jgi:hypothetical protein
MVEGKVAGLCHDHGDLLPSTLAAPAEFGKVLRAGFDLAWKESEKTQRWQFAGIWYAAGIAHVTQDHCAAEATMRKCAWMRRCRDPHAQACSGGPFRDHRPELPETLPIAGPSTIFGAP